MKANTKEPIRPDALDGLEGLHYEATRLSALASTVEESAEGTEIDASPDGKRFRLLLDLLVEKCGALVEKTETLVRGAVARKPTRSTK